MIKSPAIMSLERICNEIVGPLDCPCVSIDVYRHEAAYLLAAVRLAEGSYECDGQPDPRKDTWYFELQENFAAARSRLEGE